MTKPHFVLMQEEEVARITAIANLVSHRLHDLGVNPIEESAERWLPRLDLTVLYPEYGLTEADRLVATDCPGVNSVELLRFFDRVIVRLDPLDTEDEFRKVYFMSPRQMAGLIRRGLFLPLRMANPETYPAFFDPVLNETHVPQNSRLLTIVSIMRSGGDFSRSPVHDIERRTRETAGRRWGNPDVYSAGFTANIKRLHCFGHEEIATRLLEVEHFHTALTLASHLANHLCRPYTDALRRFTCESGTRLTAVRERLAGHARPIRFDDSDSPDLVLKTEGGRQMTKEELERLMRGELKEWRTELTGRFEIAGQDLWDLLNALVLPLEGGLKVRTSLLRGSAEDAASRAVEYRDRREIQRLLLETSSLYNQGRFDAARLAFGEVARLNGEAEKRDGGSGGSGLGASVVRYASVGARKALAHIPLIGGLLADAVDFGEAAMSAGRREGLERLSRRLASAIEHFLPGDPSKEEVVCPLLTWSRQGAGNEG